MASKSSDDNIVREQLRSLRDVPQATPSESALFLVFDYLIGPLPSVSTRPLSSSRKHDHWFCSRASELTVESATFLLRLHAYSSERVDLWRKQLKDCLRECCRCARHLQLLKLNSKHT